MILQPLLKHVLAALIKEKKHGTGMYKIFTRDILFSGSVHQLVMSVYREASTISRET